MSNTTMMRKVRTSFVAAAIFAIGAGLGWQLADNIFHEAQPTQMVASIRFEEVRPDTTINRETVAVRDPAPSRSIDESPRHHANAAVKQSDEERRLADALQWAEKYRQQEGERHAARQREEQMQRLAAAEALRWAEVAEQSRRFGQGHADIQSVIRAQIERERTARTANRVALASGLTAADATAEPVVVRSSLHAKHTRKGVTKRTTQRHAPARTYGFVCPLRWLAG